MLKFIRGKGQQVSVERQKLQKELFAFRKTVQHGFPHKPTALAYDPAMKLMAIGTQTGVLKVFGKPGVEFYGQHTVAASASSSPASSNSAAAAASDVSVQLLEWVPGSGRILSLTTANQLTLWEPAGSLLVPIRTLPFDGKLKKVSSLCCSQARDLVWIGTEGGNVYQFDLSSFTIKEPVIYHDVVLEQVPGTYKLNPGAIECIRQVPGNEDHLLITYNRGLCVLWDLTEKTVVRAYIAPGHGQSVGISVSSGGQKFTWYHGDGSYATWDIAEEEAPSDEAYVPYGPDPCKAINRLVRAHCCGTDEEVIVFSGGMPRSAYGDHQCVSVHYGDGTKVALDFTSKVIDFFVTLDESDDDNNNADDDNDDDDDEASATKTEQAHVLVVLLEEELIAYDLSDKKVPAIRIPYLHSIHASAVTCNHLVSQVTHDVYEKIVIAGQQQQITDSIRPWPVTGGIVPPQRSAQASASADTREYDILLTGHEDGTVRFWDCTNVVLTPLLHLKTAPLFSSSHHDAEQSHDASEAAAADDGDPPFRRAGQFDPYSDDPRLAVKKVSLCAKTGIVAIAGTAGHVVVASFDGLATAEAPLKVTTMNLVSDRDGFVWKGHDQLTVKGQLLNDTYHTEEGIQIVSVLQVLPPAAITCICLESKWNLVAAGTAHGLVLYDYFNQHPVFNRCTLNPNDLSGAGEALSRKKSFKKTLRESFRRLRRGRSQRNNAAAATTSPILETRPIERQIEARATDDGMGSMIRCLAFAQTYITNMQTTIATLWSATNSSCVSVFVLHLPAKSDEELPAEQRKMVTGQLAKEIQLKHRAPVVGIEVVDHNGIPLHFPGAGMAPHRVLIASEEQFKVFSLPQLKPVFKYKLTAHEGARVRRMQFAQFSCPSSTDLNRSQGGADSDATSAMHTEVGLLCLTNLGDVLVLSVPELRRQLNAAAVRREDINGISSLCFTSHGEALYMMSSSEVQRVTLSATKIVAPEGVIAVDSFRATGASAGDEEATAEMVTHSHGEDEDDEDTLTETDILKNDLNRSGTPAPRLEKENRVSHITNGGGGSLESSPNKAIDETITSSMGDITVDSVRDHLNSTTTSTIHSQVTDEIVGRVSVLTTRTSDKITSATIKDLDNFNTLNLKDLSPLGDTHEANATSVVVKSVITSISHGGTNGESESVKRTTTTTRKESQF